METRLRGQIAMVSGASKGIGFAIADALAAEGMHLSLCARTEVEMNAAAKTIQDKHDVKCLGFTGDMTHDNIIESWVDATINKFDGIDILVNNAGVTPTAKFDALTIRAWRDQFDLKPFGYIEASHLAFPVIGNLAIL